MFDHCIFLDKQACLNCEYTRHPGLCLEKYTLRKASNMAFNYTSIESILTSGLDVRDVYELLASDPSLNNSFWTWANEYLVNKSRVDEDNHEQSMLKNTLQMMRIYYTPSVIVFGAFGNIIVWIMLLYTKLRYLSCTHYLTSVIVVNILHLLALLVQWLTLFGIDLYNTVGFCQFVSFINSLCVFLSVWLVVAFAVDRYIASAHTLHAAQMCTTIRAKLVIIGIVLLGFVVYMNICLTVGVIHFDGNPRCTPMPSFLDDLRILTVFDMIFNIVLPYSAIVCLDVILIRYHCDKRIVVTAHNVPDTQQVEPDNTETENEEDTNNWRPEESRVRNSYDDVMHVPMRSFAIVFLTYFLITRLPSEVIRLIHTTKSLFDPYYISSTWEYYCQVIAQQIYISSLATHVIIFSLFHKTFRTAISRAGTTCLHKTRGSFRLNKARWTADLSFFGQDVRPPSQNDSSLATSVTYV